MVVAIVFMRTLIVIMLVMLMVGEMLMSMTVSIVTVMVRMNDVDNATLTEKRVRSYCRPKRHQHDRNNLAE